MNLKSKIESILFLSGEGIDIKRLEKLTGRNQDELHSALSELAGDYKERGIRLIEKDDEWQFGTAPENSEIVEALVKSEFSEGLSKASLEVLSITAYKGPLTRAEIEYIRGVNSSYSIRSLMLRGLVERIDNPKDARSYLYRISFDFLKYLGLEKREDLPQWEDLHKTVIKTEDDNQKPPV